VTVRQVSTEATLSEDVDRHASTRLGRMDHPPFPEAEPDV
jgi:hypothetical protein